MLLVAVLLMSMVGCTRSLQNRDKENTEATEQEGEATENQKGSSDNMQEPTENRQDSTQNEDDTSVNEEQTEQKVTVYLMTEEYENGVMLGKNSYNQYGDHTERTFYTNGGSEHVRIYNEYDQYGNRTIGKTFVDYSSTPNEVYEYQIENGKTVGVLFYDAQGTQIGEVTYELDSAGRRIGMYEELEDGYSSYVWDYDDAGNVTLESYYTTDKEIQDTEYTYENGRLVKLTVRTGGVLTYWHEYIYENDQLVTRVTHNADGSESYRFSFAYDSKGCTVTCPGWERRYIKKTMPLEQARTVLMRYGYELVFISGI